MSNNIEKPKTRRGEATQGKLIQAAAQLFNEKGYYETTIADITGRAGVGNGTFYIYFDSKLSLYKYLLQEYGKRIRANSSAAIEKAKNRREAEKQGIKRFFEFVLKEPEIFAIIWESLYIDKDLFDEFYTTFAKSYTNRLKKAQKEGEVRHIDPNVLSYVLMGITNFVALNSIVLKKQKNVEHIVDEIMEVLDKGMFEKH